MAGVLSTMCSHLVLSAAMRSFVTVYIANTTRTIAPFRGEVGPVKQNCEVTITRSVCTSSWHVCGVLAQVPVGPLCLPRCGKTVLELLQLCYEACSSSNMLQP
jgi:hypothetical protein